MRTVQYFTDEYLEHCKQLTPAQILEFIAQFQKLHAAREMARNDAALEPNDPQSSSGRKEN